MNFVGIGSVPPVVMLLMIGSGAALYLFYLWGLSRLLLKAGLPVRHVASAVVLDAVLVMMHIQPWLWYRLWHPPLPISAFVALMILAFAKWPQVDEGKPPSGTRV